MDKLVIGKIINTRGLKGEIKIENHSSFTKQRYQVGNTIYLSNDEDNYISKKITHFSINKGFVYLMLEGINTLEEANKYRDYFIYCDSFDLKESKDIYHFLTLKDMEVIFKGKVIGKVVDIENNTRQDLLRIDTGNKTFLIPFLKEFIVNIDKENKKIEVKDIEVFYEA
jgi:16S rRNA processing protein RimM